MTLPGSHPSGSPFSTDNPFQGRLGAATLPVDNRAKLAGARYQELSRCRPQGNLVFGRADGQAVCIHYSARAERPLLPLIDRGAEFSVTGPRAQRSAPGHQRAPPRPAPARLPPRPVPGAAIPPARPAPHTADTPRHRTHPGPYALRILTARISRHLASAPPRADTPAGRTPQ